MIGILGGGAFGTALAVALAREGRKVTLWARRDSRPNDRLPGVDLPDHVSRTTDLAQTDSAEVLLLAVPMQALGGFLAEHRSRLDGRRLVTCCKGIDLSTLQGPSGVALAACPSATVGVLTGPGFARDIALGLPTALTIAARDAREGSWLQSQLSTRSLRLYRSSDVTGAELGGALKNIVAIAAGVTIGAGLGESARAALMTRGYAEMVRLALTLGARAETLAGLSGLGDLVLTCTSTQSRNFRFGAARGADQPFDPLATVEGVATAKAVSLLAKKRGIDMPITQMIAELVDGRIRLNDAIEGLLSRPLKEE